MGLCTMESVMFDLSKSRKLRKRGSLPELFHAFEGMLFHRRGLVDRRNRFSADLTGVNTDWPIQFHDIHGDNVALSHDKARARRADSFCKSICFSNRPIAINERVYLKFSQTSSSWSGVLRFGFTSLDPGSTQGPDLPRYACPDMTNKPGNWAKALGERYAAINNVLHFWYNRNGDVMFGINGEDIGLFFTGVATNTPLWALMDIYGNTIEIELVKFEAPLLNNMLNRPSVSMPSEISAITSQMTAMTSETQPSTTVVQSNSLPIKYYTMTRFSLMQWHKLQGKNIQITDPSRTIANRTPEEFCNGYVFSSRPLKCGEKVVLQVLGIDRSYVGGLAVGFTTCSPDSVSQSELPDDADLLLDRMEYWVVNKDVYRSPEIGDELCFHLTNDGEVRYSRNNSKVATLMHVDRTLPLWIFFDIYGNIQKMRCLGVAPHQPPVPPRPRSTSYLTQGSPLSVALPRPERPVQPTNQNIANSHASTLQQRQLQEQHAASMVRSISVPSGVYVSSKSSPPVPPKSHSISTPTSPTENMIPENDISECTVCYEREVNSVLYKCGHVCMCFECAIHVKEKGALCPICRQTILDVIKIYKT
ncbi:protein neuralized-like isoform X1 [Mytilus galloprovincialis]|uniref:protein neuralized-like isoform X1 n=1 Tax=Mytilus galloprovincialis TaxID=29158 RepID=UPI003F7CC615